MKLRYVPPILMLVLWAATMFLPQIMAAAMCPGAFALAAMGWFFYAKAEDEWDEMDALAQRALEGWERALRGVPDMPEEPEEPQEVANG